MTTMMPPALREILVDAVGRVLLHAVWQTALVAAVTALVLFALRRRTPRARYAAAGSGLAMSVLLPVATWRFGLDDVTRAGRMTVLESVDRAVGLPAVFDAANWIVPMLAIAWLAGVAILLIRLAQQWHGARRLRLTAAIEPPEFAGALVARLAGSMRIRARVELRMSDRITAPMTLGWRQPIVLLPPGAIETLSPEQIEAVLAHELAHVRARDYLVNLVQVVADALLFFHPAARWLSHQVRREREFRCDDAAIGGGRDRLAYARALAALEESRCDPIPVAASASAGPLVDRIARLLGRSTPRTGVTRRAIAAAMTLLLAVAAVTSLVLLPPGFGKGIRPRTRRPPLERVMPPSEGLPMQQPDGSVPRSPAR